MTESHLAGARPVARTLSPRELGDRWHCSVGWLANRRCAGLGPSYLKIGTKVLYRLEDVEAFEKAGRVEPIERLAPDGIEQNAERVQLAGRVTPAGGRE